MEAFSGSHDFLNNAVGAYDDMESGKGKSLGRAGALIDLFGETMSLSNVLVAAPLAVGSVVQTYTPGLPLELSKRED